MILVRLVAWRCLLALAVVTLNAVGPEVADVVDDDTAVELPLDRPGRPRPHQRCHGPPHSP
jgi:hypothetical protein